jgi:hypothetical protein
MDSIFVLLTMVSASTLTIERLMNRLLPSAITPTACLVVAVFLVVGCAEEVPADYEAFHAPATQLGLLTIVYSETGIPGSSNPTVIVDGVFSRASGFTHDDVLYAVNLPNTPDRIGTALGTGDCEIVVQRLGQPLTAAGDSPFIELMDVGEIRVRFGTEEYRLTRRSFPELFEQVHGVTYDAVLSDTERNILGNGAMVEGLGSETVGDFRVDIRAPHVPRLLAIDGQPVTTHYASLPWDRDIRVRWLVDERTPPTQAGVVYLELNAIQLDQTASLRCVVEDTGTALLPRTGIQELLPNINDTTTLRMVVRRITEVDFSAPGLHGGMVFFISRDSVLIE